MITAAALTLLAALPPGQLPKLQYYGGRVIEKVRVVTVLWGSNVDHAADIAPFYRALVAPDSTYGFNWLDEYATPSPPGARVQHIGFGDAPPNQGLPFTIHPPAETGPITDTSIVQQLLTEIARGGLPPPDSNNGAYDNTVYMVHFPLGATITTGGATSCVQFCAYHGTAPITGSQTPLVYGVIPDHQKGSGCETGCGSSKNPFDNVTNSASHELIEMVTDPDVGLTTTTLFAFPSAWIDPLDPDVDTDHSEIGDICAEPGDQATFNSAAGTQYVVQKEWSNTYNACIGTKADAFGFKVQASSLKFKNSDTPAPLTLQINPTAGAASPPSVTISVPNLPSGVTMDPPSSTTAPGDASLTFHVAGASSLPTKLLVRASSDQTTAFAQVLLTANTFTLTRPMQAFTVVAGQQGVPVQIPTKTDPGSDPSLLTFSLSGRDGLSGTFSPPQVISDGSTAVSISAAPGTPSGAAPVTISATTGLVTRITVLQVTVDGDDFALSLDRTQDAVRRGGSTSVAVATANTHGANQVLALSAQSPDGIAAAFDPPQIQSGQTSKLTLTTGDRASYGAATITILAQGPHSSKQSQFMLGVGQTGCSSAGTAPALAALALLFFRRRR
jgi:hypothetical protein